MLRMPLHHDTCSGRVLVAFSSLTYLQRDQIFQDVKHGCSLKTAHQSVNSLYLGQITCLSVEVIENRFGICDTRPSSKGQLVGELKCCTVWWRSFFG